MLACSGARPCKPWSSPPRTPSRSATCPSRVAAPTRWLIRVHRAGLCGTDLHIHANEYLSDFPLIPGHEFCGTIEAVGKQVEGLEPGERVAVDPNLDCGHCTFCRRQQNNHCLNWEGIGITRPGAFAELVAVPARACYRLPPHLSDAQGTFIEPLSCVLHGMDRLKVAVGEEVLLYGAGPMGLLLVQVLRHGGAGPLVVVEKRPERRELARQLGAHTVLPPDEHLNAALHEAAPHGFPVVIDATGVPTVIEQAIARLRPGGRDLQFGVAPRDASISLKPFDLFRHDWTLLGSFALCYQFERAVALISAGVIDVEPLISHVASLDAFDKHFHAFTQGKTLKVHFAVNG